MLKRDCYNAPLHPAGWFSLNVPSGLTLYWFTNNILTTAQSVYLRRFKSPAVEALTTDIPMGSTTIVKDKTQEKKKEKKSKGKKHWK